MKQVTEITPMTGPVNETVSDNFTISINKQHFKRVLKLIAIVVLSTPFWGYFLLGVLEVLRVPPRPVNEKAIQVVEAVIEKELQDSGVVAKVRPYEWWRVYPYGTSAKIALHPGDQLAPAIYLNMLHTVLNKIDEIPDGAAITLDVYSGPRFGGLTHSSMDSTLLASVTITKQTD